jgi:hypothetical protein
MRSATWCRVLVCAMAMPARASAIVFEGEDWFGVEGAVSCREIGDGNGVCRGVVESMFFEHVGMSFRGNRARDRRGNTACGRSLILTPSHNTGPTRVSQSRPLAPSLVDLALIFFCTFPRPHASQKYCLVACHSTCGMQPTTLIFHKKLVRRTRFQQNFEVGISLSIWQNFLYLICTVPCAILMSVVSVSLLSFPLFSILHHYPQHSQQSHRPCHHPQLGLRIVL